MDQDINKLLKNILENKSYNEIATELNVAVGTVKRWTINNSVPSLYKFELMKIAKIKIDYSKFNYKEKDQFYTPEDTAKYCHNKFCEIISNYNDNINNYNFIEPSAGSGNFLKVLPKERTIALDIEPNNDNIIEADYLNWTPSDNKKYYVLGNPPFGLRGQLALKFINHSYKFADYVAFILPQLFESDGKGAPRKRVQGFNLIHSEKLNSDFLNPDNKKIKVNCIFQIWSKYHINEKYKLKEMNTDIMKIYSLSDGDTSSSIRNKKMFDKCDIYIPSTCFGKENMKYYLSFESLPGRRGYGIVFNKNKIENKKKFKEIEWSDIAFLSTNSAYNLRSSQIFNLFN